MQSDESGTTRLYNILRERLLNHSFVSFSLSSCGTNGNDGELVLTDLRSHSTVTDLLAGNESETADQKSETPNN